MATFQHAFVSLRVLTDRDTKTTSYIDVVDGFNVLTLPAQLPPFAVTSVWEQGNEAGSLAMRIDLIGPNGEQVLPPFEIPAQQIPAGQMHRINLNLAGVTLQQPGRYYARIEEQRNGQWTEVGRVRLDVTYVPPKPTFVVEQAGKRVPLRQ